MTAIRIVINDRTEFDGELDEWVQQPPEFAKAMIKPNGARPEAHILGIMMAMSNAVVLNQPTSIEVKTYTGGWEMKVDVMS